VTMRKRTTALERCDRVLKKARQHLKELQACETLYELPALDDSEIRIELQDIREEIDGVEDYIKSMRAWRRKSLSKLQKWDGEDRIRNGNKMRVEFEAKRKA